MRKMERAILKNAFETYRERNTLTSYFVFPTRMETEVRAALDNLYEDGYIELPRPALSASYVTLTDEGFELASSI
ncbi:hypothetical protein I6G82_02675 [Lysinibacillus macroides]|uniref:Uncharacterized protein n=1 Tax=Lysinibacillus macroides TaxID=33935 RepID=A0A0M9DJ75_9BACI|nr:hypothetical protein [Lysinibacillus macroides]KOY81282.1 hypothetical protein ADM90_19295 [Lysinibacillus macroides]QPR68555.1 hypothetical protein I6G82_02675 [Lysinibacillus macroides]